MLPLTRGVFPKLTDCSLRCDFENGLTQKKNGGGEEDENTGLSQMTAQLKSVFRGRKASVFHNGFGYCSIMKHNGGGGGGGSREGGSVESDGDAGGPLGMQDEGGDLTMCEPEILLTPFSLCRLHQSDRPHFSFFFFLLHNCVENKPVLIRASAQASLLLLPFEYLCS